MNIEEMTKDEIRLQIEALENRLNKLEEKTIKTGILKHDLYDIPSRSFCTNKYGVVSPQEKIEAIKEYENRFKLIATKGTKFYCNMYLGEESWSGENGEFLSGDAEWAENNLENIQDCV
jgi:hypothetical protein